MVVPRITKSGSQLPNRVVFHGVEGVGKTSFAAHSPSPLFGMSRGETGLLTLLDNGRVPETAHFDEWDTWGKALGDLHFLARNPDFAAEQRCLVIDTANGLERLCHEAVCADDFGNSLEKFLAYGKGPEIALRPWTEFLTLLDAIREERKMGVILLCHTKVKTFKNPEGEDYDRYTPDMNEKTWGLTHKWADLVLFGNWKTDVKKDYGALKAKSRGERGRYLYTQRTPAFDAKQRHGIPVEISMGTRPAEAWQNLAKALQKARAGGVQPERYEDDGDAPPSDPTPPAASEPPKPAAAKPAPEVTQYAKNGNGTPAKPAAKESALPADGAELQRRLSSYDALLAKEKLIQPGELVRHVVAAGVKAGYDADLSAWTAGGIALATEETKWFERSRRRPKPPRDYKQELEEKLADAVAEGHVTASLDVRSFLKLKAEEGKWGLSSTWTEEFWRECAMPLADARLARVREDDEKLIDSTDQRTLKKYAGDRTFLDLMRLVNVVPGNRERFDQIKRREFNLLLAKLNPQPAAVGAN
jgi:hypothetical protein